MLSREPAATEIDPPEEDCDGWIGRSGWDHGQGLCEWLLVSILRLCRARSKVRHTPRFRTVPGRPSPGLPG